MIDKNQDAIMMAYDINYELWDRGFITDEEWTEYCKIILNRLLDINRDVLVRLKER